MDAIVDAQNKYMAFEEYLRTYIKSDRWEKLLEYCKNNYKENMYPSEVTITPGFNLNMPIIHVLSPIYRQEMDQLKQWNKHI